LVVDEIGGVTTPPKCPVTPAKSILDPMNLVGFIYIYGLFAAGI